MPGADDPGTATARAAPIRTAEVVAALSLATDLGTGQPLEHALRTCVLATRLDELAGAGAAELADTYYVALDTVTALVFELEREQVVRMTACQRDQAAWDDFFS